MNLRLFIGRVCVSLFRINSSTAVVNLVGFDLIWIWLSVTDCSRWSKTRTPWSFMNFHAMCISMWLVESPGFDVWFIRSLHYKVVVIVQIRAKHCTIDHSWTFPPCACQRRLLSYVIHWRHCDRVVVGKLTISFQMVSCGLLDNILISGCKWILILLVIAIWSTSIWCGHNCETSSLSMITLQTSRIN
jgi:hypothetical protein